jgi:hypothetical protein
VARDNEEKIKNLDERKPEEIVGEFTEKFAALMLMQLDDLIAKRAKAARRKKSQTKEQGKSEEII